MKKGGYLIIDLLNHKLSDTPVIIEGIYNAIADNDEKMLLISGMMEDDILYDDMVGFAVPNDDVIEVTVGTKKLTITVDDEVTISNAGGGGGGSVNVVNSLTSDSTSDALSAKQGKVLKGLVDGKLPINQGSENAGKYMKVADDGSVEYAAGGGGGSISVIDNLTSDSSTDALSAKQGKVLKDLFNGKFIVVTGTLPSQVATFSDPIQYPEGCNGNNVVVISGMSNAGGSWFDTDAHITEGIEFKSVGVKLNTNNYQVRFAGNFGNKPYKITFMRTDI